jgi:hypothetical protein
MAQVALQIRPDVARSLHGLEPPSAASRSLEALAAEFRATLEPVHPRNRSELLLRHFTLRAPDEAAARRSAAALRRHEAVEGAWVTPPAAPPA